MLVLSRQRDESIMIGDNIVVTIVEIRGDKVRLGINAPTEIPVHRQEVYEAIQRNNEAGRQVTTPGEVHRDQKAADTYKRIRTLAEQRRPKEVDDEGRALEEIKAGDMVVLTREAIERIARRKADDAKQG